MKRFNPNTVRSSHHLAVTPLKSMLHDRREYKKALDIADGKNIPKERKFTTAVKPDFAPRAFGRRTKGLSPEKRAMVQGRKADRVAFFASLGVRV